MSNEVRLSKADIDTLKSLYPINQTLKIVGGDVHLKTINEQRSIACETDLEAVLPRDFCIYDLREFIGVVSIIENPVLDFTDDKFVVVRSEDGKQKLRYLDGSANLINSYFEKDFKLPSEDLEVEVSAQQLKAVMTAAQTLKLSYVGFRSEDGVVYLSAFDRNNGSGEDTNGYSVEVGATTDTFDLFYKAEALAILDGDCVFEISSRKISKVTNGAKIFWMSMDAASSFE